jgi:hypothetical protein
MGAQIEAMGAEIKRTAPPSARAVRIQPIRTGPPPHQFAA